MKDVPRKELTQVLTWAEEKLHNDSAPWEWYQLMKLKEAAQMILHGVNPFAPTEGLPESGLHLGPVLQLVGVTDQIETAQYRPVANLLERMPKTQTLDTP
jgi:hypothetical protein